MQLNYSTDTHTHTHTCLPLSSASTSLSLREYTSTCKIDISKINKLILNLLKYTHTAYGIKRLIHSLPLLPPPPLPSPPPPPPPPPISSPCLPSPPLSPCLPSPPLPPPIPPLPSPPPPSPPLPSPPPSPCLPSPPLPPPLMIISHRASVVVLLWKRVNEIWRGRFGREWLVRVNPTIWYYNCHNTTERDFRVLKVLTFFYRISNSSKGNRKTYW